MLVWGLAMTRVAMTSWELLAIGRDRWFRLPLVGDLTVRWIGLICCCGVVLGCCALQRGGVGDKVTGSMVVLGICYWLMELTAAGFVIFFFFFSTFVMDLWVVIFMSSCLICGFVIFPLPLFHFFFVALFVFSWNLLPNSMSSCWELLNFQGLIKRWT